MSHIFLVLLYWLILYCKKRKEKQFCIVLWTFDLMDILNYIPSKSINIFSFSRQFLVWLSEKFCLLGISSFSCFNISQPVPCVHGLGISQRLEWSLCTESGLTPVALSVFWKSSPPHFSETVVTATSVFWYFRLEKL